MFLAVASTCILVLGEDQQLAAFISATMFS
jgi:hypothetical protein